MGGRKRERERLCDPVNYDCLDAVYNVSRLPPDIHLTSLHTTAVSTCVYIHAHAHAHAYRIHCASKI